MKTGITLCMIVKNEARFIEGCLKSVSSIVDDIIIIDTGSTDATLDLAHPFNPQILRFQWCNDFSKARNVGLEAAKTPWILMLDADERIAERDLPRIVEAVQHPEYTGFELLWRNYGFDMVGLGLTPNRGDYAEGHGYPGYTDNPMFRLYRNDPRLRYEGVVHEHITWKTFPGAKIGVIPALIHHYGRALGEQRKVEKGEMYLRLGYRKIEEFPERWEPLYEIALQLQELGRQAESIPHLEKALKMDTPAEEHGRLLLFLAGAYKKTQRSEEAIDCLLRASAAGYENCPVHLMLGNLYAATGRNNEAAAEYEWAAAFSPESPLPALNLGVLMRNTGNLAGAEIQFRHALELNTTFSQAAIELAAVYGVQNRLVEAEELLAEVHQREPENFSARQSLAKIYIQLQQPERTLELLSEASDDLVSETLRGIAYSDRGALETGRSILENVVRKDRTMTGARINLATAYARLGEPGKALRHLAIAYDQTRDPALLQMAAAMKNQEARATATH